VRQGSVWHGVAGQGKELKKNYLGEVRLGAVGLGWVRFGVARRGVVRFG